MYLCKLNSLQKIHFRETTVLAVCKATLTNTKDEKKNNNNYSFLAPFSWAAAQ
jgi:hypothetical protein